MQFDTCLIDGDMLAYVASTSVQKEIDWGDGLWTLHAYLEDAQAAFTSSIDYIISSLKNKHNLDITNSKKIYCFSDNHLFRKDINPNYKSNRSNTRKPVCYKALVEWIKHNYVCMTISSCEADDCISSSMNEHSIIISGDKDFNTVEGYFYDFKRDILHYTTEQEAMYNTFVQALAGDRIDGYFGCPKIGIVTARKILDKVDNKTFDGYWDAAKKQFEKAGLTEGDLLVNYRMAHLLTDKEVWEGVSNN